MNFTNCLKRKNFVELDRVPSQISGSHPQRSRAGRDPFEGDPFKVQSLNFRYADKPAFFPISDRCKRTSNTDKTPVKNIYYNHDHTIPKCDKENLPLGHSVQSAQSRGLRKSASIRSFSVTSKMYSPEKSVTFPVCNNSQLGTDSKEPGTHRKRNTLSRELDVIRSKSFVCPQVPSSSSTIAAPSKRVSSPIDMEDPNDTSESSAAINMGNATSCHITIKINGVPRNRVHINKNNANVEINLNKQKKVKKLRSPKAMSPHALKPARSYIIHKAEPPVDSVADIENNEMPRRKPSIKDLKECSTHSMIPHREEKIGSQLSNFSRSSLDTIKAYSGLRVSENFSQTPPNRTFTRQATMLEKILSNNPIVVQPKGRVLFSRSKSSLCKRCSSTTIPTTR